MKTNRFQSQIQSLPEVASWPDLHALFDRLHAKVNPDWELPLKVCGALGGNESAVLPGAAALACMQLSIIFVDDMLDHDPRGEYKRRGHGVTANLSLALQATAFRLVEQAPVSDAQRTAATACLAKMVLATAHGQHLDVQNLQGEENYWLVVEAKSTPFYSACYELGAILAGANAETVSQFSEFGKLCGEIIQLDDDLTDAFVTPANADWHEGRNNLLILYAKEAAHPEQELFRKLLSQVHKPESLEVAQQILIRSGAVSYCCYHLINRHQAAYRLLKQMQLPDPAPIAQILDAFTESLVAFLELSGQNLSKDAFLNLA